MKKIQLAVYDLPQNWLERKLSSSMVLRFDTETKLTVGDNHSLKHASTIRCNILPYLKQERRKQKMF
jgi:hypothetical protein